MNGSAAGSGLLGNRFRNTAKSLAQRFYELTTVSKEENARPAPPEEQRPFGLAGIWDVWPGPEGRVFVCAVLTTTPNDPTRRVRDRMPVILKPEAEAAWLDPSIDSAARVMSVVGPYPAQLMEGTSANPALNKHSFEGLECLLPPTAA